MRLCLVQPANTFKVPEHRHALALTFPYIIRQLNLSESVVLDLYVQGRTPGSYTDLLDNQRPDRVLISANTATFPNALRFAREAKRRGITTIIGGSFPTMNACTIASHYTCFDVIVVGSPPPRLLDISPSSPLVVCGNSSPFVSDGLASILNHPIFAIYHNDPVCYEIANGCTNNCTFCTMRYMWGRGINAVRNPTIVTNDFSSLSTWKSVKFIDDDFLQSIETLEKIRIEHPYETMLAETRIDRLGTRAMRALRRIGITHLILGVETFDDANLRASQKTSSKTWLATTRQAIESCLKNSIVPRPVLQLLFPEMSRHYLASIMPHIRDWTPSNGIELLFVFYTPHPGTGRIDPQRLITRDLSQYDHLTPVYMPEAFDRRALAAFLHEYNACVHETQSIKYNPPILGVGDDVSEYDMFF